MEMQLIFATNNQHKADEINAVLPPYIKVITLQEAGMNIDIPEPHDTLEDNAREKAQTIYNLTQTPCFSEDTGLEVTALNGEPGVKSARYAGEEKSFDKNIQKLLQHLQPHKDKTAQFRTVICLIMDNTEYLFEGVCKGHIISTPQGTEGFGYDPVFVPLGASKTFAQMSMAEKNEYSHRRKAVDKLVAFLNHLRVNQ